MLYLISTDDLGSNNTTYTLFETHTESVMTVTSDYIKILIQRYKMEIKNVQIKDNNIHIKTWPHSTAREYKLNTRVLIAKVNNDKFKLVNYNGDVIYMSKFALEVNIEAANILNCKCEIIRENGRIKDKIYKSIDTYNIKEDKEFEVYIATEYEKFRSKSLLLGLDISFGYKIENNEVKITQYNGTSKKVIIPNFIHTICAWAFEDKGIEEVVLNNNLKYIGKRAFDNNNIQYVVIPESVQMIQRYAFDGNKGLYTERDDFNADCVKILNKNIKIL